MKSLVLHCDNRGGMAASFADRPAEKKQIVRKPTVMPPLHAACKAGNEAEVTRILAVRAQVPLSSQCAGYWLTL